MKPTILVVEPSHYNVSYTINPWMKPGEWARDPVANARAAAKAFDELVSNLEAAGARVEVAPGSAGLPDMVFPANAAVVFDGRAVTSRFRHAERQGEEALFQKLFADLVGKGHLREVAPMPEGCYQEGAGDCIWDAHRGHFWAGYGPRSCREAAEFLAGHFGREVVALELATERCYHLDVCFCPLSGGEILYYPKALTAEALRELHRRVPEELLIEATEEDLGRFCVNAINIGREVVMSRCGEALRARLTARGYRVRDVDLSPFMLSGGGAFCMTLRLDTAGGACDGRATPARARARAPANASSGRIEGIGPRRRDMVTYVGVSEIARLVRRVGIEPLLTRLAAYIREDFLRWERFEKSARLASHSPHGVIELMPTCDGTLYAFKFVNGHPGNTAHGKLTVTALGVLADVATGYPLLLSELTIATALRTAATSALAASVMARKDAKSMAIIGNGAQSEFQVLAFRALLGINEVRAFDTDAEATRKLIRNLAGVPGLVITPVASVEEAVRGADIVTTATADKSLAEVLDPGLVEPGMHINALGGDCPGKTELHPDVLRAARVVVEFEPQTRIEGDIQQVGAAFPVIELWRVLSGEVAGRESRDQVTVFDSVGFAIEDFSTLRLIRDLCAESAESGTIDLLPPPDTDPKDLYRLVAG